MRAVTTISPQRSLHPVKKKKFKFFSKQCKADSLPLTTTPLDKQESVKKGLDRMEQLLQVGQIELEDNITTSKG